VTEISDGPLRYRGMEVAQLALWRPFEDVAEWLWSGSYRKDGPPPWQAMAEAVAAGTAAQAALPAGTLPLERLQVIVPAMAATDQLRLHLDAPAAAAAVLTEVRRRALPEPNIDFALAVLGSVSGMIPGAGEGIFAVARTAGWIAHALEEYARDIPLRPHRVHRPAGPGRESGPGIRAFTWVAASTQLHAARAPAPSRPRPSSKEAAMPVRRLNHAVLYVRDLASTVRFYRETLGFEVRTEVPGRAAFLRAPDSANDHDLGLFQLTSAADAPAADPGSRAGLYHLAWEVGTLADLADTRAKLAAAGALVGQSDHRVSKSLYAKDPNGIEFEVMWRVPAEDWERELSQGDLIAPLDLDADLARWGERPTGAAAGSAT
jgi:catechol 2,3-dioxygenase-like lactoylglutathione lyase family enzyme